jgi:hypothetical protein
MKIMDRKKAIRYISLLLGGTITGANVFLTGCKSETQKNSIDENDSAYLDEIADTILPATSTPGAKAAKVGSFMVLMVNDCYDASEQQVFIKGMQTINDLSAKKYSDSFVKLTPQQRHALLVELDEEQKQYMKNKKDDQPSHYFRMMKELTLLGYFTSEIGCTQAKRYVAVPGRFEGCIPYKKGDKAWAT